MSSAEFPAAPARRDPPSHWQRLPLFPLPRVQLFPNALLPLHVFEPRYRDMVRDALEGARLIAVASLEPGFESDYHGRPAVRAVVGVGEVIDHEPIGDGRYNILLRGIGRARIERELPPRQTYRLVEATELVDVYDSGLDGKGTHETLVLLAEQLARKLPSGGETLRELTRSQSMLGALTDVLGAALVTDPDDRQALLELVDVAGRADRVGSEIATILSRLTSSDGPAN
jgi:uncharacterized protein